MISKIKSNNFGVFARLRGFPDTAKKLRQRLRQNQVVTPSQLDTPVAIKSNSRITITASSTLMQIHMAGKALQNGSIGELIRVRNVSSNRELEARVIAPGIVEVAM